MTVLQNFTEKLGVYYRNYIVHTLMVEKGLWFILSGSSARKLKKHGANTLGGRAIPETLYPLVWPEVAAISDGEMLNYSNIASDCGVSAKTVQSYFQTLPII